MEYALHFKYKNATVNPCCLFFVALETHFILLYFIVEWKTLRSLLSNTDLGVSSPALYPNTSEKREQRGGCVFAKHQLQVT